MSDPVTGKVIRILNDREVALNRGHNDGLKDGEYIGIVDPDTENLEDPETGESLGGIRRYKVALRVSRVSERAALAATYKTTTRNVGGSGALTNPLTRVLQDPKYITEVERLSISDTSPKPLGASASRVQEGDLFEVINKETAESGFTLVQL